MFAYQGSLFTTDNVEAAQVLAAKNSPEQRPEFHRQMARTHLAFADAKGLTRTWEDVMEAIINLQAGNPAISPRNQNQPGVSDSKPATLRQGSHNSFGLVDIKLAMNDIRRYLVLAPAAG